VIFFSKTHEYKRKRGTKNGLGFTQLFFKSVTFDISAVICRTSKKLEFDLVRLGRARLLRLPYERLISEGEKVGFCLYIKESYFQLYLHTE